MDITPVISKNKNVIKGYGDKSFRINDKEYRYNLMILPEKIVKWPISSADEICKESLDALLGDEKVEILLVGCGEKHIAFSSQLHAYYSEKEISITLMTTGAACRTYNVLLSEERSVAAALIAI